jgi:hypothetical protein
MKKVVFKPLPKDLQESISALTEIVDQCEKDITDFDSRHFNGPREEAVIYCLRHSVDLSKGCLALTIGELPDSLTTLSRALLDTFFWARYITMSPETAQEFIDSTNNELKRIARKNLVAGYAKVIDNKTNDDKSEQFLNSPLMKDIPKRIQINEAARIGGLEKLYSNIYGFDSMIAHGRAFDLLLTPNVKDVMYTSVCAALGALEGVDIITADWIISRKQTPKETLVNILGF